MRRFKVFLTSLLVIVLVFGAYSLFSFYQQRASGDSHVVIYLIEATPTDFFLVPVERNIEGSPSPAVAMQALLNGPLADEEFFEAVPKGTKLLNLVVQGKLATRILVPRSRTIFLEGHSWKPILLRPLSKPLQSSRKLKQYRS